MKEDLVLELKNITASYPGRSFIPGISKKARPVLNNINIKIPRGKIIGLVGESGSGKTSIAKLIIGLFKPSEGQMLLNGVDMEKVSEKERSKRSRQIQMLFQNPYSILNPKMMVSELLLETCDLESNRPLEEKEEWVSWLLKVLNMSHRWDAFPDELSGGERRRVSLARVLLTKPDLIIADEPVAGLDSSIKSRLLTVLWQMKLPETAYLIISHDLQMIESLCDEIYVILNGEIVEKFSSKSFNADADHHPYTRMLINASKGIIDRNEDKES